MSENNNRREKLFKAFPNICHVFYLNELSTLYKSVMNENQQKEFFNENSSNFKSELCIRFMEHISKEENQDLFALFVMHCREQLCGYEQILTTLDPAMTMRNKDRKMWLLQTFPIVNDICQLDNLYKSFQLCMTVEQFNSLFGKNFSSSTPESVLHLLIILSLPENDNLFALFVSNCRQQHRHYEQIVYFIDEEKNTNDSKILKNKTILLEKRVKLSECKRLELEKSLDETLEMLKTTEIQLKECQAENQCLQIETKQLSKNLDETLEKLKATESQLKESQREKDSIEIEKRKSHEIDTSSTSNEDDVRWMLLDDVQMYKVDEEDIYLEIEGLEID